MKNLGHLLNFFIFVFFVLGIAFGFYFKCFLAGVFILVIFLSLTYFFYRKNKLLLSDIFILLSFLALGALWVRPFVYRSVDDFLNEDKNLVTLKVISLPQERGFKNTLSAQVSNIDGITVNAGIKVMDYTRKMEYLNSYKVIGRLGKREFSGNTFYMFWVKSKANFEKLPLSKWDSFLKAADEALLSLFKKNMDELSYRFSASVFLGRRELFGEGRDIFRDAGISHLLAISGSNIALVAVGLFFVLQLFGIKYRPRLLIALVFLIIYTFITGANPPIARSTIMYVIFALGFFARRKINPFNSLGLAGIACLLVNPLWLADVGFQLSFLSVFALILGSATFPLKPWKLKRGDFSGEESRREMPELAAKLSRFFGEVCVNIVNYSKYTFFASLFVTLLITPLVALYFGRIYILSIVHNLILIPFFGLINMLIFTLITLAPFSLASQSLAAAISLLVTGFMKLTQFLGGVPLTYITYKFNLWQAAGYYLVMAVVLLMIKFRRAKREEALRANEGIQ